MNIFIHNTTKTIAICTLFIFNIFLFNTVFADGAPYTEDDYLNELAASVMNPGKEYTDEQYLDSLVKAVTYTKTYTEENYVNSLVESIYGEGAALTRTDFATR